MADARDQLRWQPPLEIARITLGQPPAPYAPRGQIVKDWPTAWRDFQILIGAAARTPPPTGPVTYTIDVPGATDFIRIPPLESEQLKRDRIARLQSARTPLPEGMRWVPFVVNKIDDAQDILYTALAIATPFIIRLAPRAVPYLGWALVANDVLNIATSTLSLSLNGGNPKARGKAIMDLATGNLTRRVRPLVRASGAAQAAQLTLKGKLRAATSDFFRNTKWGPFLIQGGQAMQSLTGYGLILGPLMGLITDTVWTTLRAAQGAQAQFRGPPPSDPVAKAVRYLTTSFNMNEVRDLMSPEDHAIMCAADCVAMQWLTASLAVPDPTSRLQLALDAVPPVAVPWSPSTRRALAAAGYDPDAAPYPPIPDSVYLPTVRAALERMAEQEPAFQEAMHREFADRPLGQWAQMAHSQAGELAIVTWITEGQDLAYVPTVYESIVLAMIEWNRFPLFWPSHQRAIYLLDSGQRAQYLLEYDPEGRFTRYLEETAAMLEADDRHWPRRIDLERMLVAHFAGWQTRP